MRVSGLAVSIAVDFGFRVGLGHRIIANIFGFARKSCKERFGRMVFKGICSFGFRQNTFCLESSR